MKKFMTNFALAITVIILFSGLIMWHAPNDERNPKIHPPPHTEQQDSTQQH